jgi:hypothetical protein
MNKVLISTVIACGLLLLDVPEAAAHDQGDRRHSSPSNEYSDSYRRESRGRSSYRREGYQRDYKRSKYDRARKMPKWLKRDRSFRRWFEHSRLRRDHWLSWQQLFEIYRWELSYRRHYRY